MVMERYNVYSDLHNNLKILQKFIPPTQPNEDVFTEGMFRIPNKKGFDRVMYYLLNIINPRRVKQCICWPLVDAKDERQFRTAVVNIVSDINKEDSSAHIPNVVPSSLQSPSGDSIAYFVRQISSYCLRTHLNISCDFLCCSVSDAIYNIQKKIIIQEIKKLEEKLSSGNVLKKLLLSEVLTAQSEYKMVKAQIKEEKMQLRGILSSAPECVKQNWAYGLSNNILDWTEHLSKKTDKLADVVLKLKSCYETVDVLNKLIKGVVGRKHIYGWNEECDDSGLKSDNHTKDFHAAVFSTSGKLKLASLVNWVDLVCKDLSHVLQQNDGTSESILQAQIAETDVTRCFDILTNIENQIDRNHSDLLASVSSRKRKCENSTCLFGDSNRLMHQQLALIDIIDVYEDDQLKIIDRLTDYIREKEHSTSSVESQAQNITESKADIASVQNLSEISKSECEEKTVTEVPVAHVSKLEQHRKPTKIPVFSHKSGATKLLEEERVNKSSNISNIGNLSEQSIVRSETKDLEEVMTKDCFDSFLDNMTDTYLEDETFVSDFFDMSEVDNSFVSADVSNKCDDLQTSDPKETEILPQSPVPVKKKSRPSLQGLIDRYNAVKGNATKAQDSENQH